VNGASSVDDKEKPKPLDLDDPLDGLLDLDELLSDQTMKCEEEW